MNIAIDGYEALDGLKISIPPGITQIKGATNSGKSSFIRSIQDFMNNSATESEISLGKKKMMINIDGDIFTRTKSSKSYTIDGVDYNKPGRGKFSGLENVKLGSVNFQNQQSPLFLIGDKASEKYSFIIGDRNKKYNLALDFLRSNELSLASEKKVRVKDLDRLDNELEELDNELSSFDYKGLEGVYNQILADQERIKSLESLIKKREEIKELDSKLKQVTILDNSVIEMLEEELLTLDSLHKAKSLKQESQRIKSKMEGIVILDTNTIEAMEKDLTIMDTIKIIEDIKIISKKMNSINFLTKEEIEDIRVDFEKVKLYVKKAKLLKLKDEINSIIILSEEELNSIDTEQREKENILDIIYDRKSILDLRDTLLRAENKYNESNKELEDLKKEMEICPLCGGEFGEPHRHHK